MFIYLCCTFSSQVLKNTTYGLCKIVLRKKKKSGFNLSLGHTDNKGIGNLHLSILDMV